MTLSGAKKINCLNKIDNIELKEDLINPEEERVDIFFKGESNSGILTLGKQEAKDIAETLNRLGKVLGKTKKIR